MSLADLIYSKSGIRIGLDSATVDHEAQTLITSLLALVAKSDGGISLDESLRMVELLRNRFQLMPGEALNMIARASDELSAHTELDEIMVTVTDNLAPAQKEDLMLIVLSVISADNQKDAAEMKLLAALTEGLKIPDKVMNKVYERYFEDQ
ncbi:MAG: TerB family tellurite resistance protein [Gammaproteobacteria bacterium]|nr:TerB family tellurite resistance protein [Gammaproteobacteria bacterium]